MKRVGEEFHNYLALIVLTLYVTILGISYGEYVGGIALYNYGGQSEDTVTKFMYGT